MEQPQSELYLLTNVELDPDYNYTLDFENTTAQQSYFMSKVDSVFNINEGYSFIRENQTLKVYAKIEDLKGVNYLMFKNNQKWFYAFVERKEYVAESVTRLSFKIDVMQTFMFDYEMQESFIDREHQDRFSADGKPIYNLQEENLNIGTEYETIEETNVESSIKNQFFYIIRSKEPLGKYASSFAEGDTGLPTEYSKDNFGTTLQSGETDGITGDQQRLSTGMYVYITSGRALPEISLRENLFTRRAQNFGMPDEIYEDPRVITITMTKYLPNDVYLAMRGRTPVVVFNQKNTERSFNGVLTKYKTSSGTETTYHLFRIQSYHNNKWHTFEIKDAQPTPQMSIDNEKNIEYETKLKTSPFSFFRVNAQNEFKELRRENFSGIAKVSLRLSLSMQSSMILFPENYNGVKNNYFEQLQMKNTNDINLRTDKWQEYVLNNKASLNGGLAVGAMQTIGSIGLGILTGGIGLAFAGGQALSFGGQVANEMIKRKDIKNQPDDIRASFVDTNLIFNATYGLIKIEKVSIKEQFKKSIFNYFFHFGYKCNDFKKPNLKSRYYFNYIKTIGVNIKTNIDSDYKNELMRIFNQGVTIWHYRNANTFKGVNNYDYENVEMSLIGG